MARLVPPVALSLAEHPIVQEYTYPDLEYFSCSAAPLKVSHATIKHGTCADGGIAACRVEATQEISGCEPLSEYALSIHRYCGLISQTLLTLPSAYGCTELSSCVSQSGVRDTNAPLISGGSLLANIKVRFTNEQGHDVASGEPGEICVSAPTVML